MRVFQVLLVDDEPYVQEGLREFIPWAEHGFSVCGQATDGREALEMIPRLHPDLMFVDIRMPVVDGLELLREMQSLPGDKPKTVILSGYETFSYYQEAIRYGVLDYLAKPLYPKEAEKVLERMHKLLCEEDERKERRKQSLSHLLRDDFNTVIHLDAPDDTVQDRFCAWLAIDREETLLPVMLEKRSLAETGGWTNTERQMAFEAMSRTWGVASTKFFYVQDDRRMLILCPKRLIPGGDYRAAARQSIAALQTLGFPSFVLYVGKPCALAKNLAEKVQRLRLLVPFANGMENCCIIAEEDRYADLSHAYPVAEMLAVIRAVETADAEATRQSCAGLFAFFAAHHIHALACLPYFNALRSEVEQLLAEAAVTAVPPFCDMSATCEAVLQGFMDWCLACVAALSGRDQTDGERIVECVRKELRAKPGGQLSLVDLAQRYHINAVYLGKLFKKRTGQSFSAYLTSCRIAAARRMLLDTGESVAKIASLCGFQDAGYFSKRFKEAEGMLPTEYREAHP